MNEVPVPQRLSNESRHPDFRPDFGRVGVRINGVERTNIVWYDAKQGLYRELLDFRDDPPREGDVEPYWRHLESRQQRRARERWEVKHPFQGDE